MSNHPKLQTLNKRGEEKSAGRMEQVELMATGGRAGGGRLEDAKIFTVTEQKGQKLMWQWDSSAQVEGRKVRLK